MRYLRHFGYTGLVLFLFGSTFVPFSAELEEWRTWISFACNALLAACVVALFFQYGKTRALLAAIGWPLKRIAALPESVLVALAAGAFFALAYYLSGVLFGHLPTEVDSMAQYAGAKILAQGEWTLPSHPLRLFFNTRWFFNDGRFYTFYPPGHLMVLAAGHLMGNPALMNPLVGALTLVATYGLSREIGGVATAKISLLLFLLSPFMVFLCAEFDNRSTAHLSATLFAWLYIRAVKRRRPLAGLLAGMALGCLIITRPQTALPYALPFMLYSAWLALSNLRLRWKLFAMMMAGVVPFILFYLYYNQQTTGSMFVTGYQHYFGQEVVPGNKLVTTGAWVGWPQEFARAVRYMQLLHIDFWGWPTASLLPAFLLFLFRAQKPYCGLLAAAFFCVFLSLTLNRYTLVIFGPRYLYETGSVVITLSALALSRLPAALRVAWGCRRTNGQWRGALAAVVVAFSAIALVTNVKAHYHEYAHNYRIGNVPFATWVNKAVQKPALVLVESQWVYNGLTYMQPPDARADIIIARSRGAENKRIMDFYPERSVYLVQDQHIMIRLR